MVSLIAVLMAKNAMGGNKYVKYISEAVRSAPTPLPLLMNEDWISCLNGTQCGHGIKTRRDVFNQIALICFPDQV